MKFGDDGDYDDSDLSPLHRALIEDYVLGNATQDDVRRALDNVGEDEGAFWDDFRDKYDPYSAGDGSHIPEFLERIGREPHQPGIYFDLPATTGKADSGGGVSDQPEQREVRRRRVLPGKQKTGPKAEKSVSPKKVSRNRRGGDHAEKKPSTVVRIARSIGRWFGFGRDK